MASTAAPDLGIARGAVDLWRFAIDGRPGGTTDHLVSTDEQERADRLRNESDRSAFLASRSGLRLILARYLGTAPAAVGFDRDDRGRPSIVEGGDLTFSLSRSRPVAVVAVTRGRAVGVDVERIRPDVDIDALARHFLSPAAAEAVRATPEPSRLAAFFAYWTLMEAMVKATGAGLGGRLRPMGSDPGGGGPFCVRSVDAGPGTAAALAVEGQVGPIRLLDPRVVGLAPPLP